MMRRLFFDWAKILLPGFHPWKLRNQDLIAKYRPQPTAMPEPAE